MPVRTIDARTLLGVVAAAAFCGCRGAPPAAEPTAWDRQRAALKSDLARAQLDEGRPDRATALAADALALSPDNPKHSVLLARAFIAKGEFRRAREVLEAGRERHPNAAELSYLLGVVHEQERNWEAAVAAHRAAVEAAPDELDFVIALAHAHANRGALETAIRTLDAARTRFSASPAFFVNLAELLRQRPDLPGAVAAYRQALRLGEQDVGVRLALAQCAHRLGDCATVVELLEPALRDAREPSAAAAHAYAGCLLKLGRAARALDCLLDATRAHPDDGALWLLLASAQDAAGDGDAALDAARRATLVAPDEVDAFVLVADLQLRASRPADAQRTIQHALRMNPSHFDALLLLGQACAARGDTDGAARAYRRAQEIEPANELPAALLGGLGGGAP
ncbi:MAG: tetratricopeptide repeat protein [Phycisphaerae bacterium]